MPTGYDFLDYSLTFFLDALRARYARQGFRVNYEPFVYGADFLPINASATDQRTVTIDQDSDFILSAQTVSAFTGATAVLNPNFTVEFTADSSQRSFQNTPVHILTTYGTGQFPFLLYRPAILTAKSTFTVKLVNQSATQTNVRLSYIGCKAFLIPA